MKQYLINEKTIAILKKGHQTIIYDVENYKVINKNIKKVLEDNCLFYGSNMKGRQKSASKILKVKYKIPLVISEQDNIILIQIDAFRSDCCLFLVANKIIDYQENNKKVNVKCINNNNFSLNISKYCFDKMLINSLKLNNYLNWLKSVNYV